jgi:predicted RecA/RadA family phage recombinase
MQNFIQKGDTLVLTAPYAVASGAGALVGRIFGLASDTFASGAIGEFAVRGVFDIAKDTSTFSDGDKVYWDNTAKLATSVATAHNIIGTACMTLADGSVVAGGASGDATVRVYLPGITLLTGE